MKYEDYHDLLLEIFDKVKELGNTKGKDYTHTDNTFDNFERHGAALNIPPEIVWAVYAGKHWDAIISHCNGTSTESESIHSRILDLITYLTLLYSRKIDMNLGKLKLT